MRRWRRVPQKRLAKLRELLETSDLPVSACFEKAGVTYGPGPSGYDIVKECRRYVAMGMWVDRKTGELRPKNLCSITCAVDKTGLSRKTIYRRIAAGLIETDKAPSVKTMNAFTPEAIETLQEIGRLKSGGNAVLSEEDVETIRKLRAKGRGSRALAEEYGVSQRQINRIISGERWKEKGATTMIERPSPSGSIGKTKNSSKKENS